MSFDAKRLANPNILELKPYQPGKPICESKRELGLDHIIKLASNENPLGTSQYVREHLVEEFINLSRYPDGSCYVLRNALCEHLKVNADNIIFGNGSEEVLRMSMQAFAWGEANIVVPEYAFIAYKILAQGLGVKLIEAPTEHYATVLPNIIQAITPQTKMIILTNPTNPTGTYYKQQAFKAFMEQVPSHILVVSDEAYYEYMNDVEYPQTIPMLDKYPNLLITRTFSKAYGLAGLRVGYGIARPDVVDMVNRLRQPFNVNHLAQVAARLALKDQEFVKHSVISNEKGKSQLYEGLTQLGLKFVPSGANFIMVQVPKKGKEIYQDMLLKGIIIRPLDPYHLEEYVRISIGSFEENVACLNVLKEVL